jgi:hypothetical protein
MVEHADRAHARCQRHEGGDGELFGVEDEWQSCVNAAEIRAPRGEQRDQAGDVFRGGVVAEVQIIRETR